MMDKENPVVVNCRCTIDGITCTSVDNDYDSIRPFEKIFDNPRKKEEKSRLMFMRNGWLYDWGLNEKVEIPKDNSDCSTIRKFIYFIKTRKF